MSHASRGSRARQLVIGIDAMEWQLVRRWASAGTLPTFRRLLERGAHAALSTTAAQLPDTVWASIYTGTNPAKFEKYFYVQYDPATMGLRIVPDDAITTPPFWKLLSDAGVRVGVADAPKFPVSALLNGFQITNWGAHATKTARTSYPKGLIDEVDGKIRRHPVGECDMVDEKPAQLAALRDRIVEGVHRHGELFRWLMRRETWDVFFAGFSGAHCIGHHFWRFADDTHRLHPPDDPHGLKLAIEQTYRALDDEIGAMSELAGPEARVMVVSGHGMGPIHHASWNLPEILEGLGYGRERPREAGAAPGTREGATNPWRILKMVLPGKLQYAIKSALPQSWQNQLLFLWYRGRQSWRGCRAFAVPNNDSVGAIRLSVIGRDKGGLVAPGAEYERICEDIASALCELTDPVTGRPVVKRATLSSEEFRGPFLSQLPDITVLWDQSFAWNAIHSPRLGTLRIRRQDARTGSHTPRGFVLVEGPGVPAGFALDEQSIYDIAPTILDAAGVPIPGIGAHAYLRRVIESATDHTLDGLEKAMNETQTDPPTIQRLREARAGRAFEDKIELAKEVIPVHLKPGGVNPFGDLHDLLSVGIHALSDEECCDLVDSMDKVLKYAYTEIKGKADSAERYREAANKIHQTVEKYRRREKGSARE